MFLLMLAREWEELDIVTTKGNHIRISGYAMPMEGGGRMPTAGFMPLFKTYEHAEAARGDMTEAPIYELKCIMEDPGDAFWEDPDWFTEDEE